MIPITVREFSDVIDYQVQMFDKYLETGNSLAARVSQHSILGLGPAGIGKSEIVAAKAKKYGFDFIDVRLAQMSEVEIAGLIYPNETATKTVWLRPSFLPKEGCKKAILFLDELTSATQRVQVAAYQLVLDRRIGAHKLPDNVLIVAAGNRAEDDGVYVEMAAPLANRFEIHELKCSTPVWLEDYAKDNINPLVMKYIQEHPENLHTQERRGDDMIFATPRSWKRVSDLVEKLYKKDLNFLQMKISGDIGEDLAKDFIACTKNYVLKGEI